jgi:hypothetical protein
MSLIDRVRAAVRSRTLSEPFRAGDVFRACGGSLQTWGTFLPKHRVGNPGGNTELFIRDGRGLYRLKSPL